MKRESMVALSLIVVAIIVFAGYQIALAPSKGVEEKTVRAGSKVQVEYIGMLEPKYGSLVFDTSIYKVAVDNITYPKVATFKMKSKDLYTPLRVHVEGKSDGGYIKVVDGFSEGLIGMKVGDTKTIIVPPEKGYGYGDKNLIKTLPIVEKIRMRETYSVGQFKLFFDKSPEVGMVVENPIYHWPMVVEVVLNNSAVVRNDPEINSIYHSIAWDVKVLNIDSSADRGNGTITVKHLVDKSEIFRVKGSLKDNTDAQIFLKRSNMSLYEKALASGGDKTFILTDVNESAGTYTIDYNDVTKGRTLVFWVKLISIDKW